MTITSLASRRRIRKAAAFTIRPNGHWGLVLAEEGNVGSAKTSTYRQDARLWGFTNFVPLVGSLRPAEDFLGIPVFSEDRRFFHYAAPRWVETCLENPYSLVLFDEWTAGTSGKVYAAMLMIMLDKIVGEVELPKTTRIFAAYNPISQAPGGRDISMANINRVGRVEVKSPTPQEWSDYKLTHGTKIGDVEDVFKQELDPAEEEKRVLAAWPEAIAKASAIWAGAVVAHPELLEKIPSQNDPQASKGFPTCRSNDFACAAMASSEIHGLNEVERDEFISAFIGIPAVGILRAYMANMDIDPVAVLDGEKEFKIEDKLDRTITLVNACASYVANDKSDRQKERAKRLWGYLHELSKKRADACVSAINPLRVAKLTSLPEARPVLRDLHPVLDAADYFANAS